MTFNEIMMIVWAVIFVVSIAVEFFTSEFVSLWFALGAIITLFFNFIPEFPLWAQLLIFFVLTILSLIFFRPLVQKLSPKKDEAFNSDGYIGQRFRLLKDVSDKEMGQVKINDVIYNCKSIKDEEIQKEEYVVVVDIRGNTLYVQRDITERK